MEPDEEVCLCFHVTQRKLCNYIRIERPQRAAQLSDCFGAGTGCGWCRPYLKRLFDQRNELTSESHLLDLPDSDTYARDRRAYVRDGGGTPPPGATPVD